MIDFANIDLDSFIRGRIQAFLMHHAEGMVNMMIDDKISHDADPITSAVPFENHYKDMTVEECIQAFYESGADAFDATEDCSIIKLDMDQLRKAFKEIALQPANYAQLAIFALVLKGVMVNTDTFEALTESAPAIFEVE